MLIDLFAPSNYISYNIQVAEVLGLKPAIYISEIANINSKAIRKDKVDEDNFFTLDRKYFEKRTTITEKEQLDIESKLLSISVLEKCPKNPDMLYLNINNLVSILASDANIVKDASKLVKKTKTKEDKHNCMRKMAQGCIETQNPELQTAWFDWIDAVIERYGKITKATVKNAEKLVNDFAQHNLDVALEIVNWTAAKGYNDVYYAINTYKERHPNVLKTLAPQVAEQREVKLGVEAF